MTDQNKRFPFIPYLINLLIPLVSSAFASVFRSNILSDWYVNLDKPTNYIAFGTYGTIRSIITLMIGTSAFLIWRRRKTIKNYTRVITLYVSQLLLNIIWAYVFFELHWIILSMVLSAVLLLVSVINTITFFRIRTAAGALFLVYLLWTVIIAYLTYGIYFLNYQ